MDKLTWRFYIFIELRDCLGFLFSLMIDTQTISEARVSFSSSRSQLNDLKLCSLPWSSSWRTITKTSLEWFLEQFKSQKACKKRSAEKRKDCFCVHISIYFLSYLGNPVRGLIWILMNFINFSYHIYTFVSKLLYFPLHYNWSIFRLIAIQIDWCRAIFSLMRMLLDGWRN
jgi:hypothetical protein